MQQVSLVSANFDSPLSMKSVYLPLISNFLFLGRPLVICMHLNFNPTACSALKI